LEVLKRKKAIIKTYGVQGIGGSNPLVPTN